MKRVVIIGGGIVGLTTAWSLHKRGVPEITIVDGAPGPNGASIVNAGWICPAHSDPVPAPGLVGASMKWMLHSDSPLYIRPNPRDLDLTKWLFAFWRSCNAAAYSHGLEALGELNRLTFAGFDEMASSGVQFQMQRAGLLCAFINPRNLDNELKHLEHYEQFGVKLPTALWGKAAREVEPRLSDAVNGACLIETERHVRPDTLTSGLIDWLSERNVDFRWQQSAIGFTQAAGKVVAIETTAESIPADAVVIAAGARSGQIAKSLGCALPIQGGKGYAIDYDAPSAEISHPISLYEAHMAMTPMGAWTRLAGTMELSGINAVVRKERVAALARGANRFIRGWPAEVGDGRVSSGLRPMTPDGLPIIDLVATAPNVAINTGHQMLGLTLAPASAEALADFMLTGARPAVLDPFTIHRF